MEGAMRLRLLPALVLLLPLYAHAQTSDDDIARAHFRTAQQYYQRDRFVDAAREFEEAYRLSKRGEILYNIGKSYDGAKDYVRAREFYRKYLTALPGSADAQDVARRAAELDVLVGHLNVVSSVVGATAKIDGVLVGTTPLVGPIAVNPGKHKVELSSEGWKTFSRDVDVGVGAHVTLDGKLESLAVKVVMVEEREKDPVYKKWWVWTIVGGVVVAGAVTGGVLGSRSAQGGGEIESPLPVAR
jgi:tetratricopeptide (TPR) repeat protein